LRAMLWWLAFKKYEQPAGVAIVRAGSLAEARRHASLTGIGAGIVFVDGHRFDADAERLIPVAAVGRLLSPDEAADLLDAIEREKRRTL